MPLSALPRLPYEPEFCGKSLPLANIYSRVQEDSIRVIRIQGFGGKGLLKCRLETQGLEQGPYTAISYTWNPNASVWYQPPSKDGKLVRINGQVVSIRDKVADILCLMQ